MHLGCEFLGQDAKLCRLVAEVVSHQTHEGLHLVGHERIELIDSHPHGVVGHGTFPHSALRL